MSTAFWINLLVFWPLLASGLLLPGYLLGRIVRSSAPWLSAFLGSAVLLFYLVLALDACRVPLGPTSLAAGLVVLNGLLFLLARKSAVTAALVRARAARNAENPPGSSQPGASQVLSDPGLADMGGTPMPRGTGVPPVGSNQRSTKPDLHPPPLLRIDPLLGTYFYRLNIVRPPLNDVRVRRALALAVDRQAIVEKILRGDQLPASAFTPPGMAGYTPPAGFPTDFAAARRLLAEAGFPGGKGLPPLELLFNSSESHRAIAEAVQETWRRELGVEVRLVNMENNSVLDARRTGSFQILRSSWTADFADPQNALALWTGDSGNNFTGWTDPTYDALLRQAELAPDPVQRLALLQQAETRLLDAAPLIPVYYYTHVFLLQPSVKGWHPTQLDHHPYKQVWLEE